MSNETDSAIIDMLGGTVATAKLCLVVPQAVSQWRRNGIPTARRMYLELARPDLFQRVSADPAPAPVAQAEGPCHA